MRREVGNFRAVHAIKRVKLRNERELVPNGRWGPRWLHRLVWRMAENLGMARHPIINETATIWRPIAQEKGIEAILDAADSYLYRDWSRDLVAFTGPELWGEMRRDPDTTGLFDVQTERGMSADGRYTTPVYRVCDIPTLVLPDIRGCVVVPLDLLRKTGVI